MDARSRQVLKSPPLKSPPSKELVLVHGEPALAGADPDPLAHHPDPTSANLLHARPFLTAPFLTAQWRNLAVLNFAIDAGMLAPYVPRGTELDLWHDQALVSLVGFQFLDTRVWGWPIPFHRHFAEVNLRFYVRRRVADGWRRGVTFVRELAPRRAVACVARWFYGENYLTVPMQHRVDPPSDDPLASHAASYWWPWQGRDYRIELTAGGLGQTAQPGTLEEFIIEHYWGYTGGRGRQTIEYRVDHPRWKLWPARAARFEIAEARFTANQADASVHEPGIASLYGPQFAAALAAPPVSAFYVDGSPVAVHRGQVLAIPHEQP